jgi:hypothetical protein
MLLLLLYNVKVRLRLLARALLLRFYHFLKSAEQLGCPHLPQQPELVHLPPAILFGL